MRRWLLESSCGVIAHRSCNSSLRIIVTRNAREKGDITSSPGLRLLSRNSIQA